MIIAAIVGGKLLGAITAETINDSQEAQAEVITDTEGLETAIASQNSRLPKRLDNHTVLESVSYSDNKVEYVLTLNIEKEDFDIQALRHITQQQNTENLCQESVSRKIMDNGSIYYFTYWDDYGKFLFRIKTKSSDCL